MSVASLSGARAAQGASSKRTRQILPEQQGSFARQQAARFWLYSVALSISSMVFRLLSRVLICLKAPGAASRPADRACRTPAELC